MSLTKPCHIENPEQHLSQIELISYGPESFQEKNDLSLLDIKNSLPNYSVNWINVDGPINTKLVENFGLEFNLHELAIEDVINNQQRSKVEDYDDHLFIVTRMIAKKNSTETEQISMFLGKNYLVTFQECAGGDCLEEVRNRIRKDLGKVRKLGPDYLAYLILDSLIDGYFPVLEMLGERIENIEDEILFQKSNFSPSTIHTLKREILALRRAVWPLRDAANALCRDTHTLISDEIRVYMRDCFDHSIRIIDLVEMYRELSSDLMQIYLSIVNNKMNEVMKVLTILTTIFIPPTFICGIYGMNFNTNMSPYNMPELNWYLGYPFALLLMLITTTAIFIFLKKRKWL